MRRPSHDLYASRWFGHRRLTFRSCLLLVALDQGFALLIVSSYLFMLGPQLDRGGLVQIILTIHGLLSVLRVLVLISVLRPAQRWLNAPDPAGDPGTMRRAGAAAYAMPARFSTIQALSWLLVYPLALSFCQLTSNIPFKPNEPVWVGTFWFSVGLGLGAWALHYPLWTRILGSVAGQVSLELRARGEMLPGHQRSLRQRTVLLALCLAVAPATWLASYLGFRLLDDPAAAPVLRATLPMLAMSRDWIEGADEQALAAVFGTAGLWALICAYLFADTLAVPVVRLANRVRDLARTDPTRYLPVVTRDEIGALTDALNDTIDELRDRSQRIERHERERDQLLQALAQQRDREQQRAAELEAVMDHVLDAVLVCDPRGRIVLINRSGQQLFGISREAGLSLSLPEFRSVVSSVRDGPAGRGLLPMEQALRGEVVREQDLSLEIADQPPLRVRGSASPIRDASGSVVGAVAMLHDLTETLEIERFKSQFVRVAAHELKTPVAVMKAHAQLLLRHPDAARQRASLEAIDRGADRIHRIVLDLLDIVHLQLETLPLRVQCFDLKLVVESEARRLAQAWPMHRVQLELPAALELMGDRERIRQLLARVMENAFKHSPEGSLVTVGAQEAGEQVRITVTDQGIGIPQARQVYVFQPFFRAHTDTRHDYGGIGVGLYIAREMVRLHGGHMDFTSEEGRGATFRIMLPKRQPEGVTK